MKPLTILPILILFLCGLTESAYSQKAKYKQGVLTGPNNEYQVKLSHMLGRPKLEQQKSADGSVSVSLTDDQCRSYLVFNHGATPYGPEGFVEDAEFSDYLKQNAKTDSIKKSYLDSRYGTVTLFQYAVQHLSPCFTTTYGDGGPVTERPGANVGVAYLKLGDNMYSFMYIVGQKPFQWDGPDISNIPERMQEFINNFTLSQAKMR